MTMDKKVNIKNEAELVKYVKNKVDSCDMNDYRNQWWLNIAYLTGKQWVTLDPQTRQLIEPPKEPWEVRLVANRVQPIVRTELAKITKNKPICEVTPASNESNDIDAARAAEKICQWLEYELGLQNIDREVALWGLSTSIGFIKPFWNPNKGDMLIDPETGEEVYTGAPDADVLSPFDVKFDMGATSWKNVRWFYHEVVRDVDEIYEKYGVKVEPEDNLYVTNTYDSKLRNLNSFGGVSNNTKAKNSANVIEYWELPSKQHKNGQRITICKDKVLYYLEDIGFGKEDDTERQLPLFPYIHINVPGRVIGMSTVEQLIPVQREYNKSRSQIIQHKNLMCNPKWLVEENSINTDITDMPGEIVEYKKGFSAPIMSQTSPIGVDVYKNIEQCIEEFYFISGQQEVSHGSTPPGVKSGVAIRFLQEQDDTKLGPSIANYIDYKNGYMSYFLKMLRYKQDIEKTINITGKDNSIEALTFKGSDITSTAVRVQEGSMFQQSKAAKQQHVLDLITSGVLNPQMDRNIIMRMLELGLTEDLYDESQIDENQAQEENIRFEQGDISPIVRDFFNHQVHIFKHNKLRKSSEYEKMPPEIQQAIDLHVQQHEGFLMPPMPQMPPMQGDEINNDMPIPELQG